MNYHHIMFPVDINSQSMSTFNLQYPL